MQLWQAVREQLKTIERLRTSSSHNYDILNGIQAGLERVRKAGSGSGASAGTGTGAPSEKEGDAQEKERKLKTLYRELKVKTLEEHGALDRALESLSILYALRSAPPDGLSQEIKRKKRRLDTSSPTPSSLSPASGSISLPRAGSPLALTIPTPSAGIIAAVHTPSSEPGAGAGASAGQSASQSLSASQNQGQGQGQGQGGVKKGTKEGGPKGVGPGGRRTTGSSISNCTSVHVSNGSASTPGAGVSSSASTSAPSSATHAHAHAHMDPAKARREALAHQLPLQKGRKVAFRQPVKKSGQAAAAAAALAGGHAPGGLLPGEEEGETWIMATVMDCINNDRNRYVVQDAEDDGRQAPTYNTTLKAIVPLPESIATLPPHDYPVGAQVMGLYPDTSCFYRATVKGGGPGLDKIPAGKAAKREQELLNAKYKLMFEDDNNDIKDVPAHLVVERPRA